MRQLQIKVPRQESQKVLILAQEHDSRNTLRLQADDQEGDWSLLVLNVDNRQVGSLLKKLEQMDQVHVTLAPQTVFPMSPPASKVPQQIKTVRPRSPLEIWLNSLQSVGSWTGFLSYTVAAGIVVWIGLFTNTIYLLVASMLIAPFAGPAMNIAIATAVGDGSHLSRNLLRYTVSLALMIGVTALLSLVLQQGTATSTMVSVSTLSSVTVLLPLAVGFVGAMNLTQAQNNSLVPGTAVGLLVAASLAPPAGVVGMAAALGRWSMALNGLFVLALQLLAINLTGSITFRLYGLNTSGPRYEHGQKKIFYISVAVSAILLAGMVVFQLSNPPALQRSTRSQRALSEVQTAVNNSGLVSLVEANVRFTRPNVGDQESLLAVVYVKPQDGINLPDETLSSRVTTLINNRLLEQGFNVVPLVQVTVLNPPATPTPGAQTN